MGAPGNAAPMTPQLSIPFYRYSTSYIPYEDELLATIRDVMERGAFILQEDLRRFESNLAAFIDVGHAVGVANGTDAMILALLAVGIEPGDEVVLPSHTFVATVAAVHFVGATPVLVECGPDHLVDPKAMEAAVTPRTRVLMPVDLNGRTCDMDAITTIAESNDLVVVEDAAQALGSTFRGRFAGTFGAAGTFSFYPAKLLGCFGDGGAVVTNDPSVARQIALLRDHGRGEDGEIAAWGLNSRLDNMQAAILDCRLNRLREDIARRRAIASRYHAALADIEEIVLPPGPDDDDEHYDVFQNYEIEACARDELRTHLRDQGIGTLLPWGGRAVHQLVQLKLATELPLTGRLFQRCLLLPMNTTLTDAEVDTICAAVRDFYARRRR